MRLASLRVTRVIKVGQPESGDSLKARSPFNQIPKHLRLSYLYAGT